MKKDLIQKKIKNLLLAIVDIALVILSIYLAAAFRFDMDIPMHFSMIILNSIPIICIVSLLCFILFRYYKNIWQYASVEVIFQSCFAGLLCGLLSFLICHILNIFFENTFLYSRGIFAIMTVLIIAFTGGFRFLLKVISIKKSSSIYNKSNIKRVMLIGAGWAGASTIRDIKAGRHGKSLPIVAVDDNKERIGTFINGVPVRGGTDKIKFFAEYYNIDEIIIAIATPIGRIQDLIDDCLSTGCKVKRVVNLTEINENSCSLSVFKDIDLNDLLGRPEKEFNLDPVKDYFYDKTVLITGGGGTIGSELVRQICAFNPKKIVIFDINENYIYDLRSEIRIKNLFPDSRLILCVGSVRDKCRVDEIFEKYKPDIVLHAAAHKHVPLMEDCPTQAVQNNVYGTYNVADSAIKHNSQSFVLISTDKAVNPTNVMGATKRLSELIIEGLNSSSETNFMIVRFGNVLGSHGSVVPLFERQIKAGGPLTLTDKNITRFFMSVQEAATLVLQAASIAKGGELFVLDMGEPVKIYDLAKRMIKLYSDPDKAPVKIEITGLRKGEKIVEELLNVGENILRTDIDKIFVTKSDDISYDQIKRIISILDNCILNNLDMRECLKTLVPTFKDPEEVNSTIDEDKLNRYREYKND